uniref:Uncharacterized protein n=1 Tax=Vitis vinifera TaxID=29760 RepID=F6I627_VITVI
MGSDVVFDSPYLDSLVLRWLQDLQPHKDFTVKGVFVESVANS